LKSGHDRRYFSRQSRHPADPAGTRSVQIPPIDRSPLFRLVVADAGVFVIAASPLIPGQDAAVDFVGTQGGPVTVVQKCLASLISRICEPGNPRSDAGILFRVSQLATSSELDVMRAVTIMGYCCAFCAIRLVALNAWCWCSISSRSAGIMLSSITAAFRALGA
jgi:hypothetical protein